MATALVGFAAPGRQIVAGAVLDDDDPVIEGREHLFSFDAPTKAAATSRVEQATAAPGELRNSRRGRPPKTG